MSQTDKRAVSAVHALSVSYTHLDVYKRQGVAVHLVVGFLPAGGHDVRQEARQGARRPLGLPEVHRARVAHRVPVVGVVGQGLSLIHI